VREKERERGRERVCTAILFEKERECVRDRERERERVCLFVRYFNVDVFVHLRV
jgi:hypothetical protein